MAKLVKEQMIDNKCYTFCSFDGQVVESNRHRETLVSSSGGGGVSRDITGRVASIDPVHISSRTIVHDEFFLVDDQGEERYVHLQNWELSLRAGHHIQMLWVVAPKQEWGPYVVMFNKNLKQSEWNNVAIYEMSRKPYKWIKWGGVIAAFVLGVLLKSFWIFLLILIGSYGFYSYKAKGVEREIHNILESLIM